MKKFKELTKEDFKKLNLQTLFCGSEFNIIISCQYIQTWEQLAEVLGNAFQFPMRNEGLDGTWDWLTDLSWLGKQDKINIYFYEEQKLLKNNLLLKEQVLNLFEELVDYWKEEVQNVFIAGKLGVPKCIQIYLVN